MCSYPSWLNNRQRYLGHRLSGASRSAPRATARPWSVPVPVSSGVTDASIFTLLVSLDLKIGNQKKKKKIETNLSNRLTFSVTPPPFIFGHGLTFTSRNCSLLNTVGKEWSRMIWFLNQAVRSCDSTHYKGIESCGVLIPLTPTTRSAGPGRAGPGRAAAAVNSTGRKSHLGPQSLASASFVMRLLPLERRMNRGCVARTGLCRAPGGAGSAERPPAPASAAVPACVSFGRCIPQAARIRLGGLSAARSADSARPRGTA